MAKETQDAQARLLELVAEGQGLSDDGTVTSKELAKVMGCGVEKARRELETLLLAGKVRRRRSPRRQILTGIIAPTWAFSVVEEEE